MKKKPTHCKNCQKLKEQLAKAQDQIKLEQDFVYQYNKAYRSEAREVDFYREMLDMEFAKRRVLGATLRDYRNKFIKTRKHLHTLIVLAVLAVIISIIV